VEEEGGELADQPLRPAPVAEDGDDGDEEDDGRGDVEQEPLGLVDEAGASSAGEEKLEPVFGEAEEGGGEAGEEGEEVTLCWMSDEALPVSSVQD
jgi:hypothetical protein